ncbi:MAG: hypothetical protein KDD39_06640, partial [Bdellovibrionales bacterium]|nr:hypothetical protein [Bdellovibrionales bacterium]
EVPRLGDDGLFYLVKGKAFYEGYLPDYPAAKSTTALISRVKSSDPTTSLVQWKIVVAVADALTPVYDMLSGMILKIGLESKWAFAVSELLCAAVMTLALAWFLFQFFGVAAAAVGLVLLNFAILPNQGLHYFIPSTFAFSLGLLFIVYIGRRVAIPNPWFVLFGSLCISGVHLIGKLYVVLGVAVYVTSNFKGRANRFRFPDRRPILAALFGVLFWVILPFLAPYFSRSFPVFTGADESGLLKTFLFNASGARQLAAVIVRDHYYLLFFAVIGLFNWLIAFWKGKRRFESGSSHLLMIVSGLMILSLFHKFFYPAESFSRLLVLFCVLQAGYSAREMVRLWDLRNVGLRLAIAGFGTVSIFGAYTQWWGYIFGNLNFRSPIVYENEFRWELAQLAQSSPRIVYGETDFSFRVALLNGGRDFAAFPYPAATTAPNLKQELEAFSPTVAIVPNFSDLNSLSFQKTETFQTRYLGIPLALAERFTLSHVPEKTKEIYFFVENSGPQFSITLSMQGSKKRVLEVPAGMRGWCLGTLPVPALGGETVVASYPHNSGWLRGISFARPHGRIFWPWDSGLRLTAVYPEDSTHRLQVLDFSPEALLKYWDMGNLWELYGKRLRVISDHSGLVFLRVEHPS